MPTSIQRRSDQFLYQQVIGMIRQMQAANTLRPGDKLPSLRALSQKLTVSVPTVRHAYGELERQGMIEARPKSGYFLKAAVQMWEAPKRRRLASQPRAVRRQLLIEHVFAAIHEHGVLPLGVANPASAYPIDKTLARIMRKLLSRAGAKATAYAPMDGLGQLKRELALRYLEYGIQVNPDEILITNGAQEALAIALQCVASSSAVIAVESPCYFGVLELIESLGMMALEIPLCAKNGVWLDDLEKALEQHPVAACIFSSSISNPLGSLMGDKKRQQLVRMLEAANVPLIEDDVYGDLYFSEHRANPAQRYSREAGVLTCSSFSKTVAPGYRVGWLLAGKFSDKARRIKRALSCSSSLLNQWAIAELIASGEYDRAISKLRNVLMLNKARMMAAVQAHFPLGTKVSNPQGGAVLWVDVPGVDSEQLFHAALDKGISICPGGLFSAANKYSRCIRISYGLPWSEELDEAIRTLGGLAKDLT